MKTAWNIDTASDFPKLEADRTADVVIVGGGIAGVLTAYELAKKGKEVVLLERDSIASGASGLTTACITAYLDTEATAMIKMLGETEARAIILSHKTAINYIEKTIVDESIDCEFTRTSAYVYDFSKESTADFKEETAALKKLGLAAKFESGASGHLGFEHAMHIAIPNQAKFHPTKFLTQIAQKAHNAGARIFEGSRVDAITPTPNGVSVSCNGQTVTAKDVIVATYQPFNNPEPTHWKKGMYKTYIMQLSIPKGLIAEGIYEDNENPYHYFRIDPQAEHDRMIIGGEDHRAELPMSEGKNYSALLVAIRKILGDAEFAVDNRWSGPILEPTDGFPLIGEYASHQYVATAFSGTGMTYGAISALLLSDLLAGKANTWKELYDPKRAPSVKQVARKAGDYIGEFFGGALKNTLDYHTGLEDDEKLYEERSLYDQDEEDMGDLL